MSYKKILIAAATFALCISAASSCKKYYIDDEKINKQIDSLATAGDSLSVAVDSLGSVLEGLISSIQSIRAVPDDKADRVFFSFFPYNGDNDTIRNDISFIVTPASAAEELVNFYNAGDTTINFYLPLVETYSGDNTKSVYATGLCIHNVEFNSADSTIVVIASGPTLGDWTAWGGHYSGQLIISNGSKQAVSQFFELRSNLNHKNLFFYNTNTEPWEISGTLGNQLNNEESVGNRNQTFRGALSFYDGYFPGKFYSGNRWGCECIDPNIFDITAEGPVKIEKDGTVTIETSTAGYGRYVVKLSLNANAYTGALKVVKTDFIEMIQDGTSDGGHLWGEESDYPAQRLVEVSPRNFEGFLWMRASNCKPNAIFTDWRGAGYYGSYLFDFSKCTGVSAYGRRSNGNGILFNDGFGQYRVQMNVKEGKMDVTKITKMTVGGETMKLDSTQIGEGWIAYYTATVQTAKAAGSWKFVANAGEASEFSLGGEMDNLVVGGGNVNQKLENGDKICLWLNRIQNYNGAQSLDDTNVNCTIAQP